MKKLTTVLSAIVLMMLMSACSNSGSLQRYLVDSQDKKGFVTVDIPTSFIQLKSDDVSEDVKKTMESIRKINLVGLPFNGNEEAYEAEKKAISQILKGSSYKTLMKITNQGMNVQLYYTGNQDAIDEVIAFGYSKKAGVGVARILGDNMNPAKIMEMMNNVTFDGSKMNLSQFNAVFD